MNAIVEQEVHSCTTPRNAGSNPAGGMLSSGDAFFLAGLALMALIVIFVGVLNLNKRDN